MLPVIRHGRTFGWLAAALLVGSCGGNGDMVDPTPDTATIQATVTLDGAAASGVTVRLFAATGGTALAVRQTGSDGIATFASLDPATYEVEVEVPEGAEVSGEARRSVSAAAGATATLTFLLSTPGAPAPVEINLTAGLTFSPDDVTIEPGTTVTWRNDVAMLHTITPDGHDEWSEATLSAAGATFSHTFNSVGTFPYFCTPHLSAGMTGVIRVE
jgi:plastocyanin